MKFLALINVMPLKGLLDPQGKAVNNGLHSIGLNGIDQVRVGKRIQLEIEANSSTEAEEMIKTACSKLLVNAVMEYAEYEIKAI